MLAPLQRLLVGLQTVIHLVKQFGYGLITDGVTLAPEFLRQLPYALTCPAEGRFRISARRRLHQPVQVLAESGILVHGSLASPAFPPNPGL